MKPASSLYTFSSPCLSCVLFCLLNFPASTHTHSHRESERESQSCTHWLHILSGCHSCNWPKSDRCSVLVAVSLTAVLSLSFIPSLNCITAQHLQTFDNNRTVQNRYCLVMRHACHCWRWLLDYKRVKSICVCHRNILGHRS